MKKQWIKFVLPLVVIGAGIAGMATIEATAEQTEEKEPVDTRPTVRVEPLRAESYQVMITGHGEVKPMESTMLSAQVAGEVISWNPEFVAGGIIKRGELLFSIESDSYQAALLQAEAELSRAKAQLIEEQARAKVAEDEASKLPANKVTDLYLRKPQLMSAKAAVKSAEAGLRLAQRDLDNCQVTAPYDALVIARNLGVGQFVSTGQAVAELNSVEYAEITVPIAGFDNAFLPDRLKGANATVTSRGSRTVQRQGQIHRDLGIVDSTTRMSQLVVRIADPYSLSSNLPALKFGSYAEVSFVGQTLSGVYRLPQELVTNRIVWVVNDAEQLESRRVNIVREEGAHFLINGGLNDNDQLVVTLPEYPQSGMQVKVSDSGDDALARVSNR